MIKKIIIAVLAATAMVTLASCDPRAKLAEEIVGTWTGNPESVLDTGASRAAAVRTYEFISLGSVEGTITISALISVENALPFNGSMVTPIQISATGNAMITGSYQVKDHDELTVALDPNSLQVAVDPEGVQLTCNFVIGDAAPQAESLRPAAVVLANQQITRAAQSLFANISEIDDIAIAGSTMTCEIDHRNVTLTREP